MFPPSEAKAKGAAFSERFPKDQSRVESRPYPPPPAATFKERFGAGNWTAPTFSDRFTFLGGDDVRQG